MSGNSNLRHTSNTLLGIIYQIFSWSGVAVLASLTLGLQYTELRWSDQGLIMQLALMGYVIGQILFGVVFLIRWVYAQRVEAAVGEIIKLSDWRH